MKHLRHLVHIVSARFFPLPSSQKENVTLILHSSFFILHSSFNNCVSTIFPSSLFPKRKCNSHSSFYILHSSFFILHSSFKKSPSAGRVTTRYFPCFLPYSLININEKANNVYFSKKYPQKFW